VAKQNQDILDRLMSSLSVRGILFHPATLFVVATAGLIAGAIFLWEGQRGKIVNLEEFQLTHEKIRLAPPPDWADADLKQLVLGESSGSAPSILDTQLVANTANVMRSVGYVERVRSVKKSKSGLDIDVTYRHPVGLVELSPVTIPEWAQAKDPKRVLLPVDRHGVVMPEKLGVEQNWPRIMIPYPAGSESLTTWADWPDERIQDAAAISFLFKESAKSLGLALIVQDPVRHSGPQIPFDLRFDSGVIIIWGNAPGKESDSEANAEFKLQIIEDLVAEYGPDIPLGRKVIDIRSGQAVVAGEAKTAANPEAVFNLN